MYIKSEPRRNRFIGWNMWNIILMDALILKIGSFLYIFISNSVYTLFKLIFLHRVGKVDGDDENRHLFSLECLYKNYHVNDGKASMCMCVCHPTK